jgi:hypothetical protein
MEGSFWISSARTEPLLLELSVSSKGSVSPLTVTLSVTSPIYRVTLAALTCSAIT